MQKDQTAKQDIGKLDPTLVLPDFVRVAAKLEEYDQQASAMIRPKMIQPTRKIGNNWYALFECPYCEKHFKASASNVMSGRQRSCGCAKGMLMVQTKGTHGASRTRLYRVWSHIKERCDNQNCREYKWYGGRGITYEFDSFEEFRDYALSHGYTDDLTCERIDVNGNYAPGNITFIPPKLQARNTRRNVMITYKGLTLCAAEWAEILRINQDTITARIRRGWTTEKALETPVEGSLDLSLIPVEVISAIRAVRLFGLTKYSDPENWKTVEPDRLKAAAYRHFLRYIENEKAVDKESGLPHLWHCCCNLAFLCGLREKNNPTLINRGDESMGQEKTQQTD